MVKKYPYPSFRSFPFNRNFFEEHEFLSSFVMDTPLVAEKTTHEQKFSQTNIYSNISEEDPGTSSIKTSLCLA